MPGWYSLLLGAALKSMGILGAAWVAAWMLRRRSAAARRLVWTAASAALLALPLLSIALPAVRVPVGDVLPAGITFQATATASAGGAAPAGSARAVAAAPLAPASPRPDWGTALMLVWAAGTALVLGQMLLAWGAMWRLRRRARRIDDPDLAELTAAFGIGHEVELFETGRSAMPMTFGVFRPAVFLPAGADAWTAERRRMVLLHELAHVRHGDPARRLLARIALGVYWWNPLAWAAWRRFLNECERAADDLVLAAGARASE